MSVSEWADAYRRLSPESSAEPGRWITARAEYQRGIMDAVNDPEVNTVVIISSAQVGKTEIINNVCGFFIHYDPAPILVVQPTVEMGQTWSKDRLAPMLRDTPALTGKVNDPRSRDSNNTQLHKTFPGGHITITGANSAAGLASRPIRILLCDEVDRYPPSAGAEGDPVNLAIKRTRTYWNRKIVLVSTPTVQGSSRIERAFLDSDQRYYFVPCPHCDHEQRLEWKSVEWDDDRPETARYYCVECGAGWNDPERWSAIKRGRWVAENDEIFAGIAGFHISELYSPWAHLEDIVRNFISAKRSPEMLKTWVNTSLGETWAERGEAPEWRRLFERREDYKRNTLPVRDIVMITAGADVQGGQNPRIEVEVVGWGENMESWSLDYRVFFGDIADIDGGPWRELQALMNETWTTAGGLPLQLEMLGVDAGFSTQTVYNWCRRQANNRVIAVLGDERQKTIVSLPKIVDVQAKGRRLARGAKKVQVGSSVIKQELFGWLKQDAPLEGENVPYGYCHFPEHPEEYFKQLTAEQLVKRLHRGYARFSWEKTRERNEALDCRVYARAVASLAGLDRMNVEQFKKLRDTYDPPEPKKLNVEPDAAPVNTPVKQERPKRNRERRKSSYWN